MRYEVIRKSGLPDDHQAVLAAITAYTNRHGHPPTTIAVHKSRAERISTLIDIPIIGIGGCLVGEIWLSKEEP